MIATPLPCNITEYKTLAICRVIFIWGSNISWLHMNFLRWERGQNGSFDVEGWKPLSYPNKPYIDGKLIYSAFRLCVNLNFEKFTLKTGFVVQGHIWYDIEWTHQFLHSEQLNSKEWSRIQRHSVQIHAQVCESVQVGQRSLWWCHQDLQSGHQGWTLSRQIHMDCRGSVLVCVCVCVCVCGASLMHCELKKEALGPRGDRQESWPHTHTHTHTVLSARAVTHSPPTGDEEECSGSESSDSCGHRKKSDSETKKRKWKGDAQRYST